MATFHRAFAQELRGVIRSLPLTPAMRVLDVGCGDGFYTGLLAERLDKTGEVIGLDSNREYLEIARKNPALGQTACRVTWLEGKLSKLPLESLGCDFAWCAQSLYSLPEPVAALRQVVPALRPGGVLAVLENDTLHELLLPWPSHLEIALRAAEYRSLCESTSQPSKYYVGRRLPAVFAAAGLEPLGFRTQCIDRQAPLDPNLEAFLQSHLARLADRVQTQIQPDLLEELAGLIDPQGPSYLPRQPYFTLSWINVLAWGRRPRH